MCSPLGVKSMGWTQLDALQDHFSAGLTPSTPKVYLAAIAAFHAPVSETPVGRTAPPWGVRAP